MKEGAREVLTGGEKVVRIAEAEMTDEVDRAVLSEGTECSVCCRGNVVLRYGWKGGCGSRCILGDQSGPSRGFWTPGWL